MVGTHKWHGEIGAAIALNNLAIQTGGLLAPRIVVDTSNRDYVRKRRVLLKNYVISLPPGVSMRLSGSQGEQEWFDLWGGINLVQFRIVGENRMEQSRTFLDTEAVIIHRFTCLPSQKRPNPWGSA
jgi:hypothetical protein